MPDVKDTYSGIELIFSPEPDYCPLCHHGVKPIDTGANLIRDEYDEDVTMIEKIYVCPRHSCRHVFIARPFPKRVS